MLSRSSTDSSMFREGVASVSDHIINAGIPSYQSSDIGSLDKNMKINNATVTNPNHHLIENTDRKNSDSGEKSQSVRSNSVTSNKFCKEEYYKKIIKEDNIQY